MNWNRLDRERTLNMIARVKSTAESMLFTPATSEAKWLPLPFYHNFGIYRLTNFSSLPTFSMDFLSDGELFYYMDGSDNHIMLVNKRDNLNIRNENVIHYINFYYAFVRMQEGEMILLKSAEEASIINLYDEERREEFNSIPNPCDIQEIHETGQFNVIAPVLYDSSPVEALITVTKDGRVTTQPRRMLTMGQQ